MKLILATHNKGKLIEIRSLLSDLNIEVLSADEVGVTEDVVEDGKTFAANALKKARFVAERSKEWAVADDAGLCIKALGGAPGVYSARWAGEGMTDEGMIVHTLGKLKNVPDNKRDASFEMVAALVSPDGQYWLFNGEVKGRLAKQPLGTSKPKLPYDSLFIPRGHDRTFAQMSDEEKHSMSHRGKAFMLLKEFLREKIS